MNHRKPHPVFTFPLQVIYDGEYTHEISVVNLLRRLANGELNISYINPAETIGDRFVVILTEK
jgi:hypothetical protein